MPEITPFIVVGTKGTAFPVNLLSLEQHGLNLGDNIIPWSTKNLSRVAEDAVAWVSERRNPVSIHLRDRAVKDGIVKPWPVTWQKAGQRYRGTAFLPASWQLTDRQPQYVAVDCPDWPHGVVELRPLRGRNEHLVIQLNFAKDPPPEMRITRYFSEILHAPVTNSAWSWGAESETSRVLFFRVWADQIEDRRVQVSWPWVEDSNGGRERTRQLDLMRSGRPTFGVICTAVKIDTGGKKRTIKYFEKDTFLRIGLPFQRRKNGVLTASIEERLSFEDMLKTSGTEAAAKDDIKNINDAENIDETTKQRLVDARLGQGRFRAQLMGLWGWRCAVTGSTTSEALRASHILPWSQSNNKARLDPANGFPLNAGIDALFDRFVITFEDDGTMTVSKSISAHERTLLGLTGRKLRKSLMAPTKAYLARHRNLFEKNEANRTVV